MKLKIQKFIAKHADWEQLLSAKPYCVSITRDVMFGKNLMMFKYSQIESDFNYELVRECRGLILDADTFEPISVPFYKFGNYGESYCPDIDWKSCWVGEKLDGSIIKIVRFGNDLLISTNGTINAFNAQLNVQIGCNAKNFGELVLDALVEEFYDSGRIDWDGVGLPLCRDKVEEVCLNVLKYNLEENKTYMFELTSPFNKVVVQWHNTHLNFLGVRDNKTLQETYFSDHPLKEYFNVPKIFPLHSVEDCIKAAEALDRNNEGYVVCDKNFNRVKIKSPLYVQLHHMKGNGVFSYERGIEIVRRNELSEVLTYFPEFKEHLEKIKDDYNAFVKKLDDSWNVISKMSFETRKDAAIAIQKEFGKYAGIGFSLLDKKVSSPEEWAMNVPANNLVKSLGYKEK